MNDCQQTEQNKATQDNNTVDRTSRKVEPTLTDDQTNKRCTWLVTNTDSKTNTDTITKSHYNGKKQY